MEEIKTKKCSRCGRELPVTMFRRQSKAPDGLQYYCKECQAAAAAKKTPKEISKSIFVPSSAKKIWHLESLASISNRDLIEELKARGFKGKLSYVYEIDV